MGLTMNAGSPYWPNPRSGTVDINSTDWRVIGINKTTRVVTPYATMALLLAAGDRPFPGLDGGGRIGQCFLNTVDSTGAVKGSGVLYKCDPVGGTAPSTAADADNFESETEQISLPCPFRVIWLKAIEATDLIKLAGRY